MGNAGEARVQIFLQDQPGGCRIQLPRAPITPPPRPQLLHRLPAGEALVLEFDGQAGGRQALPELARRGGLDPLRAIHVERQAHHDRDGVLVTRDLRDRIDVGGGVPASQGRPGERHAGLGVADGHADATAAVVEPDQPRH